MLKRLTILLTLEQYYTYDSNINVIRVQILMTICNFGAQYRNSETFENSADTELLLFIKSNTYHIPIMKK